MANFTDRQLLQFTPYISQIPIDTYAAVGLQKQAEYRAGVDKVQTYLDSVAGLNVVRPQDKEYINNKLAALTTQVNSIASSDWSNQAIVKQVGAMAGAIYNDGKVQSAIAGTKRYLKDEQDIEQAKKDGKWAPENEWILRRQMQSWLQDPTPGKEYRTGGYLPYQNVNAEIIKMWNDAKPNSRLSQKPNGDFYAYEVVEGQTVGKDGRTLIETQIKELRPDEISEQINALITPLQREQLAITGAYNGRGISTPEDMNKFVDRHFKGTEDYYDSLISQANQQKILLGGNTQALNQLNESISQLNKKKSDLLSSKADYKIQGLQNPDAVKSAMYYENWLQGISKHLGFTEASTKIVDNPAYKAQLEESKMWLDFEKARMTDQRMRDITSMKGKGKTTVNEDGSITWESDTTGEVMPIREEERVVVNIQDFKDKLLSINKVATNDLNEVLYSENPELVNRSITDLNQDGILEYNYAIKPGKQEEAIASIAEIKDRFKRGDPDLNVKFRNLLQKQDEATLVANKLGKAITTVEKEADDFVRNNPKFSQYRQIKSQFDKTPSVQVMGESISPSDVQKYRQLAIQLATSQVQAGGNLAPSTVRQTAGAADLNRIGLSAQKYELIRQAVARQNTPEDAQIINMLGLANQIGEQVGGVERDRNKYLETQLRRFQGVFNQVAINVPSGNNKEVSKIANFVQNIAATAKETGMSGATDWGSVRQMIGEKHRAETSYNYVQDRDGNVRIRISNPDVDKGAPQEIMVEPETARISGFYTPDYLGTARSLLDLGEGRTGKTFEESIPVNNGRTGRYNVRYEVENYKGNYVVNLYVSDTQDKTVSGRLVPISRGMFPDWNSLSGFLTNDLNETFIRGLLGGNSDQQQKSSAFGGSIYQNNPFIQQMQRANNQQ